MKFRTLVAVAVCGVGSSGFGVVSAQQQQPVQTRPGVQVQVPGVGIQVGQPVFGPVVQRPAGPVSDHALASCLAIENHEEVDIARFAESKAQSKDVKQFAEMIAKDHEAFLQKLEKYAPEATREGLLVQTEITTQRGRSGESVRTEAPRNTVSGKVQPQGEVVTQPGQQTVVTNPNAAVQPGYPVNFLQLHRELAQECLAEAKEGMSKKDPKDFDKCFIGHQIAKHQEMKVKLVVFQRHATGELSQIIAQGLETTEAHLKKAEQIMKKLTESSDDKQTTSTN
jgi:predicted outer membrane protein